MTTLSTSIAARSAITLMTFTTSTHGTATTTPFFGKKPSYFDLLSPESSYFSCKTRSTVSLDSNEITRNPLVDLSGLHTRNMHISYIAIRFKIPAKFSPLLSVGGKPPTMIFLVLSFPLAPKFKLSAFRNLYRFFSRNL